MMTKEKMRHIDHAISGWKRKLKGDYHWWEKKRYSEEFCREQIEYFENMKLKG